MLSKFCGEIMTEAMDKNLALVRPETFAIDLLTIGVAAHTIAELCVTKNQSIQMQRKYIDILFASCYNKSRKRRVSYEKRSRKLICAKK